MKAVILAAGIGSRLKPLTESIPKAFIQIGGTPIINYSLDSLKNAGISDVIIVTGYKENYIKQKLGNNYKGMKLIYVSNKEFEKTNSMYSLSRIEGLIDDDIILLESDLLYDSRLIDRVLKSKNKDVILVSEISGSGDEVYICVDKNNKISCLGKNIPEEKKKKAIGELVGISKFSKEFLTQLFRKAKDDFNKGKYNYHYEECVFKTSKEGYPVYAQEIKDISWIEIDNYKDLKRAEEIIFPNIRK